MQPLKTTNVMGFTRQEDMRTLSSFLDSMSGLIESRMMVTGELCSVADSLLVDDYQVDNVPDRPREELESENQDLRDKLKAQKTSYENSLQHLNLCMDSLTKCWDLLNSFSHSKTALAIDTRRELLEELLQAETVHSNMFAKFCELEHQVYAVSRKLGLSYRNVIPELREQ